MHTGKICHNFIVGGRINFIPWGCRVDLYNIG